MESVECEHQFWLKLQEVAREFSLAVQPVKFTKERLEVFREYRERAEKFLTEEDWNKMDLSQRLKVQGLSSLERFKYVFAHNIYQAIMFHLILRNWVHLQKIKPNKFNLVFKRQVQLRQKPSDQKLIQRFRKWYQNKINLENLYKKIEESE